MAWNTQGVARISADMRGPGSAADTALKDFSTRLVRGEAVIMFALRGRWLVGTEPEIQARRAEVTLKELHIRR